MQVYFQRAGSLIAVKPTNPIPINIVPKRMQVLRHPILAITTVANEVKPSLRDSATANNPIAVVYRLAGKQSTIKLIAGGTKNPIVNPKMIRITRTRMNSQAKPVTRTVADQIITAIDITTFLLNRSLTAPAAKLEMINGTIKAGPLRIPQFKVGLVPKIDPIQKNGSSSGY